MRPRISIRGSVRPSVRPSVRYASSDITQMTHLVARLGLFFFQLYTSLSGFENNWFPTDGPTDGQSLL